MKKLSLDLNALQVESFEPSAVRRAWGTVAAHEGTTPLEDDSRGGCPGSYGCPSAEISGCGTCGKGCDASSIIPCDTLLPSTDPRCLG